MNPPRVNDCDDIVQLAALVAELTRRVERLEQSNRDIDEELTPQTFKLDKLKPYSELRK